ncbi:MAG: hypothetical protein JO159_19815 [Acidobacteria bacterium]|nr:hypothetical protein [Acidobacteriota bacterium]MBV9623275.1 hypothetical protein [Acidobacteriota bacterium]
MEEGRKRVLGIMAAILAARKFAQQGSAKPSPALNCAIHDAITLAQRIMTAIDAMFCSRKTSD